MVETEAFRSWLKKSHEKGRNDFMRVWAPPLPYALLSSQTPESGIGLKSEPFFWNQLEELDYKKPSTHDSNFYKGWA